MLDNTDPVASFGTTDQPFISVESWASVFQDAQSKTKWTLFALLVLLALLIGEYLRSR